MRRQDFHFDLPPELIAQRPPATRDGARLLRLGPDDAPEIADFPRLVDEFRGDEVLVLNDTRVVPARVFGHKPSGGAVEVLFVEPGEATPRGLTATALLRGKRLVPGSRLVLPGGQAAEVLARAEDGQATVRLPGLADVAALHAWLEAVGEVPLPPYIDRPAEAEDRARYQTVVARAPGAVAAPTAGLHFTADLLATLAGRGVEIRTVTLHVGLGTFLPMRVDELSEHRMHAERFQVPPETVAALESGRPIVAVGTTVVRALESWARDPGATSTALFITPGFEFRVVDGLVTNFHLPESTLLMLVCAFAGMSRVLAAYRAAVEARMRFFSYGDAMLLRRPQGRWTAAWT